MTTQADLTAALFARVDSLAGFALLWPRKGATQPAGEHVRVALVPNDNLPADLSSDVMQRRGFVVLTLVSALGEYQIEAEAKAGTIAAHFPRALRLTSGDALVQIVGHSVRQAREEGGRWETPVWIEYRSIS